MSKPAVIVISGPTCSGKSTLEQELLLRGLTKVTSHTTRPMRPGEVDGKHYHFVSEAQFDSMPFIETIDFGGARYGKSVLAFSDAVKSGEHVATVLEPVGARALRRHCAQLGIPFLGVWIDCPPHIQAARFIERVRHMRKSDATQRLGEMLSIEQDWRQWMQDGYSRYELRLSSFSTRIEQLADSVLAMVNSTVNT